MAGARAHESHCARVAEAGKRSIAQETLGVVSEGVLVGITALRDNLGDTDARTGHRRVPAA